MEQVEKQKQEQEQLKGKLDLQGWFSAADGKWYSSVASRIHGGKIVEIGTWKGLSTSYIGKICNENHNTLWCVDTWEGTEDDFKEEYVGMVRQGNVLDIFLNNMRLLGITLHAMKMTSQEASSRFEDNSLDFVFLDASHDYDNVKRDLEAWEPKLRNRGIFGGHDFHLHQSYFGLRKAVMEFALAKGYQLNLAPDSIWFMLKEANSAK